MTSTPDLYRVRQSAARGGPGTVTFAPNMCDLATHTFPLIGSPAFLWVEEQQPDGEWLQLGSGPMSLREVIAEHLRQCTKCVAAIQAKVKPGSTEAKLLELPTPRPGSITVEPMTQVLRQLAGRETDPNHLAVVHRTAVGYFQAVLHTTDDIHDAYAIGRLKAGRLGATVLTRSTYAPTVVGADIAARVIADPLTQPLSRL